ncbi:hypothetical protein A3I25_02385 [Candidatus Nomurabacteria bacterium RIFCSPLOWO2_02_FULL_42_17]|uniref:Uncharacterized protein n=2 Tax=Candidatus Nomuraibacteriota TaxID=1752729 RepID=A0A1F6WHD8_9BACT|nr:MAG: ATP synthase subunit delta [Parcubacteria group bacterium GW2011_GWA2_42_18]OGI81330.1 MAG: hypothetical protein A3B93_01080 [Candidatus Nomurabacteria bacterium RIFCSPHIGHO2_02_FULL_42_24]OGI97369.1 MAG: hypothetical protein A3I25_02385 [Candidatus Nomurabacteria bacterium RIFCSPLOWO2_02_FULL_42_17]
MIKPRLREISLALYEATVGKNHSDIDLITRRFIKTLFRWRILPNSSSLIKSFQEVCDDMEKKISVKITSARKLKPDQLKIILSAARKKFKVDEVVAEEVVDQNLMGGWKLEARDTIIDASLYGRLKKIHSSLIKI